MRQDVRIETAADLDEVVDMCVVRGNLVIASSRLELVELPKLEKVIGSIEIIDNVALEELRLPELVVVREDLLVRNNAAFEVLDLPALRHIENRVEVVSNPVLADLNLPAPETVGGLLLQDNASLARVALPSLWSSGHLVIEGNGALVEVVMPLVALGELRVTDNEQLEALSLPKVRGMLDRLIVEANPLLARLELPGLQELDGWVAVDDGTESGDFAADPSWVRGNAALVELELPELTNGGSELTIADNAALERLSLPKLQDDWHDLALEVTSNPALVDLELPGLVSVYWVTFSDNAALTELSLPNVVSIAYATFSDHAVLAELSLPSLTNVNGWLKVEDNPVLETLSAPNVPSTETSIYVSGCPGLTTCIGAGVEPFCPVP